MRAEAAGLDAENGAEPALVRKTGRKRDATRDAAILEATITVMAESGYEGMTMDMVAERARASKATVYRRWTSKPELVLDAVTRMKQDQVDLDDLPDTGTLRGDILALFKPRSVEDGERKLRAMAGLSSMLSQHSEFAEAAHAALVEPWAKANRRLIRRAAGRGEVSATADVETLAQVIPSVAAYRALVRRKPFDRSFLVAIIDGVLLPALARTTKETMAPSDHHETIAVEEEHTRAEELSETSPEGETIWIRFPT